jgi:AmmeMemoRadiSam system protein A
MEAKLSAKDQSTLLSLAYESVGAAVRDTSPAPIDLNSLSPPLREERASFVTLTLSGALRGCIGTIAKCYPLAQDVVIRAAAAATRDPRFKPVKVDDLDKLEIEVSVLSDPQPLNYQGPKSLPSLLNVGVDGVIIHYGYKRATFLPQVWERVATPEQFLTLLCRKALLPDDFWKSSELLVETYQVQSFHR